MDRNPRSGNIRIHSVEEGNHVVAAATLASETTDGFWQRPLAVGEYKHLRPNNLPRYTSSFVSEAAIIGFHIVHLSGDKVGSLKPKHARKYLNELGYPIETSRIQRLRCKLLELLNRPQN